MEDFKRQQLTAKNKSYILKEMAKPQPKSFVEIGRNINKKADTVSQFYRRRTRRQRPTVFDDTYEVENIISIRFKKVKGRMRRDKPVFRIKWVGYEDPTEIGLYDFRECKTIIDYFLNKEFEFLNGILSP